MKVSPSRSDGFTLMEAIVATALLALAIVAVQRGYASGTRALRLADQEQRAVVLAQAQLAAAGNETALSAGASQSGSEAGMEWTTHITRYSPPDQAGDLPSAGLYWVETEVRWRDTAVSRRRSLRLTTLKLSERP